MIFHMALRRPMLRCPPSGLGIIKSREKSRAEESLPLTKAVLTVSNTVSQGNQLPWLT